MCVIETSEFQRLRTVMNELKAICETCPESVMTINATKKTQTQLIQPFTSDHFPLFLPLFMNVNIYWEKRGNKKTAHNASFVSTRSFIFPSCDLVIDISTSSSAF